MTRCAVLVVLLGVLGAAAQAMLPRDGEYAFTYFGRDLGSETFSIAETSDGFRVQATLRPKLERQTPSSATYILDSDRNLVKATFTQDDGSGISAEYTVQDGILTSVAMQDGVEIGRQEVTVGEKIVTGPHYVTDFWVLHPLGQEVNETRELEMFAFGFTDWRVRPVTVTSKRERNRTAKTREGAKVESMVYACTIRTSTETFKTRSYIDSEGVSVKIRVGAPLGWLNIRLGKQSEDAP